MKSANIPKPKLTVKQAKFVKGVAEGKPKYKAAMDAYDTTSMDVAANIANENLKKTTVQEALQLALHEAGITPEKIMAPVVEALNHQDLDMKLKGHDRAVKIVQPKADPGNTINNFGTIVAEMRDKYAD